MFNVLFVVKYYIIYALFLWLQLPYTAGLMAWLMYSLMAVLPSSRPSVIQTPRQSTCLITHGSWLCGQMTTVTANNLVSLLNSPMGSSQDPIGNVLILTMLTGTHWPTTTLPGHRPRHTAGRGVNMIFTPRSLYQEAYIVVCTVEDGSVSTSNTMIK